MLADAGSPDTLARQSILKDEESVGQSPFDLKTKAAARSGNTQASQFAALLNSSGVRAMVGNLETDVAAVEIARASVPLTMNVHSRPATCYVCCPSAAYIGYAREELRHFTSNPILSGALNGLIGLGVPLLWASGLDAQVQPNNWLLATNPLPFVSLEDLTSLTRRLSDDWPGLAIVWRSLNDVSDSESISAFRAAQYVMLPARQIYLFDCREEQMSPRLGRDERRDASLLGDGAYSLASHDTFAGADFERARLLYQLLYLDKYTWLNPHYTADFLRGMHELGLLEFHGLRGSSGELDGVVAFFDSGRVMTAPIVGYDTAKPQTAGLYRRLMAIATARARYRKMLFNMSAGAAGFKRSRGGVPAIEYSAVYARHLGLRQRAAIGILRGVLQGVGVPLLRRFAL